MEPSLIGAYIAAITFDIAMPLALAALVRRRLGVPWRYFGYGALIFFLFQIISRVPAVQILQSLFASQLRQSEALQWAWIVGLALTAGLFEEVGRYLGYRYLVFRAKPSDVSYQLSAISHQPSSTGNQPTSGDVNSPEPRTRHPELGTQDGLPSTREAAWRKGVMFGLGHGGIESMLLVGGMALLGLINGLAITRMDPSSLAALPADQAAQVRQAQLAFQNLTWWMPLLGAAERLFSVAAHVAFSILVLQVFLRNSMRWLYLAIGAHFLMDLVAVAASRRLGAVNTEVVIGLFALAALYLILRLRPSGPARILASEEK